MAELAWEPTAQWWIGRGGRTAMRPWRSVGMAGSEMNDVVRQLPQAMSRVDGMR